MVREAIFHEAYGVYAYPSGGTTLRVRLRTAAGDGRRCKVYYTDRYDYTPELRCATMELYARDERFDYYSAAITLKCKRFKYFFEITGFQGETIYYSQDRLDGSFPPNVLDCGYFQYPYINRSDLLQYPDWAKDAVFYEIFPDRFCRGEEKDPEAGLAPWGAKPRPDAFFGGDIKGIEGKLDYLSNLGITAIYLTPIFLSESNHKYDTIDYYRIDPHLGSAGDMKRLVQKAHGMGIRIVLDAVFNHMSDKNAIFRDVSARGEASPYAGWFYVDGYPVVSEPAANYETFGTNIAGMPRINTCDAGAADYLIAFAEYWTRELDIDGWRLDVADEVPHRFWKEFRTRLRAIKPDLFIIGEVWYRATPWLMGDEFDSVMNYTLRKAVLDFIARKRIDAMAFAREIQRNLSYYKNETADYSLNLVGSHDTDRILTLCGGDVRKLKLAMTLLMTFPGIPMLYYGDEAGLEGAGDVGCRGTMPWGESGGNDEIAQHIKRLIRIRKSCPAVTGSGIRFIDAGNKEDALVYVRGEGGRPAIVIINNSEGGIAFNVGCQWSKSAELTDRMSGRSFRLNGLDCFEIYVDGMDCAILC